VASPPLYPEDRKPQYYVVAEASPVCYCNKPVRGVVPSSPVANWSKGSSPDGPSWDLPRGAPACPCHCSDCPVAWWLGVTAVEPVEELGDCNTGISYRQYGYCRSDVITCPADAITAGSDRKEHRGVGFRPASVGAHGGRLCPS
jgi:hypothetical protein